MRREAMYLEGGSRRFELALQPGGSSTYDKYTLSQIEKPHEVDRRALDAAGVPLPASHVTKMHDGLDWEEIVWGPSFMRVRGEELPLQRLLYVPHTVV